MSGIHFEARVKKERKGGVERSKKETNIKDQAQPKESARYACDGRHKGCDERHTKSIPVTSVTHGVTDVTPFPYIFGTRNATDHVEATSTLDPWNVKTIYGKDFWKPLQSIPI